VNIRITPQAQHGGMVGIHGIYAATEWCLHEVGHQRAAHAQLILRRADHGHVARPEENFKRGPTLWGGFLRSFDQFHSRTCDGPWAVATGTRVVTFRTLFSRGTNASSVGNLVDLRRARIQDRSWWLFEAASSRSGLLWGCSKQSTSATPANVGSQNEKRR
jgi:hypothetical protein